MNISERISKRVQGIPRSGIRDFFELVQGRDDVISLGVGEPDFCAPWHIREAAIYSLEKGETSYTSNLGLMNLRKSIAGLCRSRAQASCSSDRLIAVTSAPFEAK